MKRLINFFILSVLFFVMIFLFLKWNNPDSNITYNIRLPRLILVLFVGFVLGGVGNIYQMILNNPLAEPYVLGISSGSALGSILANVLGFYFLSPIAGFLFAILTMFLVWKISTILGDFNSIRLILSGIIISMFLSAIISLLIFFNKKDIASIFQVLMGNTGRIFSFTEWKFFIIVVIISFFMMLYLFGLGPKLTLLSLGDLSAHSMGVNIKKIKRNIFVITSLLIGIVVSYAGIIGFVGLIIPHLTRMLFARRPNYYTLYSSLIGAIFLLICDFISAHIALIEIPVGIVTAFVGAPFFIYLLIKKN